jgi:hypothetical protein
MRPVNAVIELSDRDLELVTAGKYAENVESIDGGSGGVSSYRYETVRRFGILRPWTWF